ncbi:hypothetical protein ERX37_07760 [Macrococcus hajekii]|uniref:Uncharacterized protein n=1 Tax=Macrococcus hajekii TaxID=198482 RepID=A0A4R6BK90_9STAP|nr:hypothetical protein [Macrococcus hajekii]TDM02087.1 hypothetical protein ERX37_07760 [Macrococcus hajekii]GGB09991.1 hypothetical protein GCM10007190_17570 [Macrococcus hajekii]
MTTTAERIINYIEMLGVHDKGLKRAHARGYYYNATVELTDEGKVLLGDNTTALVRLSDAPPNKRTPEQLISLKGLAIRFNETDSHFIFINFPYFPFVKKESILKFTTYVNAIKQTNDWMVIFNLLRKIGQLEQFGQRLGKLAKHFPLSTIRRFQIYHNLHYFKTEQDYVRFHVEYHEDIKLYAERYSAPTSIEKIRHDGKVSEIGRLVITQEIEEDIPYFELLKAGPYLSVLPDDDIIQLRDEMYQISADRRLIEQNKKR